MVHNVLSLYFIDRNNFDNMEDYLKVANGVLNHHNYCNNYHEMSDKDELINSCLSYQLLSAYYCPIIKNLKVITSHTLTSEVYSSSSV